MNKPRHKSSGFGDSPTGQSQKPNAAKGSPDQGANEKQAVTLIHQGKLEEAERLHRQLIKAGSKNHIIYCNLAAICGMQGRYEELVEFLNKALELNPNYPDAHNNLGVALKDQGDVEAAITSYKTALQLNPDYPDALYNLGVAFIEQGDLDAAIASFNKTIDLNPNYPDAHNYLGIALMEQGDLDAAVASFTKGLELNSTQREIHNNLGNALQERGDLDAAVACYNTAIELSPQYPEAHNNLGNALMEKDDLVAAIDSLQKAINLNPYYPDAYNNLGNALSEQGDLDVAIACYNKALELNPNFIDAHRNLSAVELLRGDYTRGLERYECRLKGKGSKQVLNAIPNFEQWRDSKIRESSKLLLVSEQGLGDTLQFMRYAIALRDNGTSVSICAPTKLHTLIQTSGIDPAPLSPQQADEYKEGKWMPLLSVPRYLEVTPEHPIITEPYIKTTNQCIAKWEDILSPERRPIIGINWQGNPSQEKSNFKGRSLPLETFAPLASRTNASLLSLQKGFGSEQREACSFRDRFVRCQPQIDEAWDFLETAAIIANCDLVITSDTSVAHLAGGMGKTTWVLLKKIPEWRWGLVGETSFWYPSMRLFRQQEHGNWDDVLARVADAFQEEYPHTATNPKREPKIHKAPQVKQSKPSSSPSKSAVEISAPISLGELIDKITILEIKTKHLEGSALANVKQELTALKRTLDALGLRIDPTLIQRLKEANTNLWQIEDAIRIQERQKSFGETFIHLARSVYQQNDLRAAIKKEINIKYGSTLTEEKSYQNY